MRLQSTPMTRTSTRILGALLVGLFAFALGGGSAAAQGTQGGLAPQAIPLGTGEMDLKVLRFGIGNRPRPGDWAGIQVELTNRSDRHRDVVVRLAVPDAEGDTAWWERTVSSEPGSKRSVWLYARLPFDSESDSFRITAHEAVERPATEGRRVIFVAGQQIGATVVTMTGTSNPVSQATALIGVVGPRAAGVDQYPAPIPGISHSPTGHERIDLVAGLRVSELPDHWLGLAPLEALVWTASGTDGEPRDLTELQARAIREWVHRGGHLVVVLPPIGQGWMGRGDHMLADIMPAATVRAIEGVSLEPYRKLLTSSREMPLPDKAIVNVLEPHEGAGAFDAVRIIDGPDGQTVVVRRLVGAGAVTVIGLDLLNRTLAAMGGIDADILWNRVLGKRLDLLSKNELDNSGVLRLLQREDRWLDRDIAGIIAMTGKAASGLLLAFFVFLLYWLAAGPLGYFGLRRIERKHHAWVAFVLVGAVFTVVAWGGASMIRPRTVQANHLTFLDHVYGQPNQRARMWANLLLPEYGEQRVSVAGAGDAASPGGSAPDFRNAITSWDTPTSGIGLGSDWMVFPDARGYPVDARSPDSVELPARSTIRQLQVDWAGAPRWRMPSPMLPEGGSPAPLGSEIKITKLSDPPPGQRWWNLRGTLVHDLPGALHDVVVVVVPRQGHLNISPAGALIADAHAVQLSAPWKPGEPLDLAAVTAPQPRATSTQQYFRDLAGNPSNQYGGMQDEQSASTPGSDSVKRLTALAFYSMLEPPRTNVQVPETSILARRQSAHTWDLGRWFTQPCIIIVGHLDGAPSPIPMVVDGEPVVTTGRTVVRWIYPLPPDPPRFDPILQGD